MGLHMEPEQYMRPWAYLVHTGPLFLSRLSRDMEAALDISALEYEFLTQIKRGRGETRMTDLADNLWVSKAGVTKIVDRLEKRGLVERSSSPKDRRVIVVSLTADGDQLFSAARRLLRAFVKSRFAGQLNEREVESLGRILEKLLKAQDDWETLAKRLSPAPKP